MEKGKIREQGTLRQLEVRDPDLTNEWSKIMNLGTNENECKSKTARDRWNLFRLVSRIGNQLKHRNSVHGTWTTSEETHVVKVCYVFFLPCLFGVSLSFAHNACSRFNLRAIPKIFRTQNQPYLLRISIYVFILFLLILVVLPRCLFSITYKQMKNVYT